MSCRARSRLRSRGGAACMGSSGGSRVCRVRSAGRLGWRGWPAVELDDLVSVDRVVECLPDANVVERGEVRVDPCEIDDRLGVGVQLSWVLERELVVLGGRDGAQIQSARPCSIAVTASWVLGTARHTIEVGLPAGWAAWDHSRKNGCERTDLGGGDRADPVRPGARHGARAGFVVWCSGWDRRGKVPSQVIEEIGVGRDEMERQGPGPIIGDDPGARARDGGTSAAPTMPSNGDAPGEPTGNRRSIARRNRLRVTADRRSSGFRDGSECVCRAAVARRRDREREVGNEPQTSRPGALLEVDQRVVGQPHELWIVGFAVERRVDRGDSRCLW